MRADNGGGLALSAGSRAWSSNPQPAEAPRRAASNLAKSEAIEGIMMRLERSPAQRNCCRAAGGVRRGPRVHRDYPDALEIAPRLSAPGAPTTGPSAALKFTSLWVAGTGRHRRVRADRSAICGCRESRRDLVHQSPASDVAHARCAFSLRSPVRPNPDRNVRRQSGSRATGRSSRSEGWIAPRWNAAHRPEA